MLFVRKLFFVQPNDFAKPRPPWGGRETLVGQHRGRAPGRQPSCCKTSPASEAFLFRSCFRPVMADLSSCSNCKCDSCRIHRRLPGTNDFRWSKRAEPRATLPVFGEKAGRNRHGRRPLRQARLSFVEGDPARGRRRNEPAPGSSTKKAPEDRNQPKSED